MPASHSILAIGGAHIDRRGRVLGEFVPGASNPGEMREEVGGGVFNAARALAGRGHIVALLSARGGDAAGDAVAAAIERAGLADFSAIFLDRATPSYTAILDRGGDVVAALADMALYDLAFDKQLRRAKSRKALAGADAILCDANLPAAALERLAGLAGETPLFAIGVSPAKVTRLRRIAGRIACLFINRREAAVLAGADADADPSSLAAALRAAGLTSAVVTAGSAALVAFDDASVFETTPPAADRVADVTGAGDALAGTVVSALVRGQPFADAVREGLAAARLCIESTHAAPDHDADAFARVLATIPPLHALPLATT